MTVSASIVTCASILLSISVGDGRTHVFCRIFTHPALRTHVFCRIFTHPALRTHVFRRIFTHPALQTHDFVARRDESPGMAPRYYSFSMETTILWPGQTGVPEWLPAITVLVRNDDFVAGVGGSPGRPPGSK